MEDQKGEQAPRDFGTALNALKNGYCIARDGWNGKGMFIYLNYGSSAEACGENTPKYKLGGVSSQLFKQGDIGTVTRMPNLNMKAADGSIVTGWLASQTDILAEDWTVVELPVVN